MSTVVPKNTKDSIRLCHLADIHLGYRAYNKLTRDGFNQREVDVIQAFHEAVERVVMLSPDAVIIAGDLFHSVRPSNAVITTCFRELKKLVSGTAAPLIITAGNHETPRRSDSGSLLRLFEEIDGVYVADQRPRTLQFKELSLSLQCIPHAALVNNQVGDVRADDRFKFNVLVLHGQVGQGWPSDLGGVEIDLKNFSPHEWDYIALGHVHVRSQVALNAEYSGAIEHTAFNIWAEPDTHKGFLEIELPSGKRKFHALTSPREVLALKPINAFGLEATEIDRLINQALSSVAGGVEGKIIRLEVQGIPKEVERQLDYKAIRAWRARALNLTLVMRPPMQSKAHRSLRAAKKASLKDELKSFAAEWEKEQRQKKSLVPLIMSYLEKEEEQNETPQP
ncbi:MAG: hypothetical protein D6719_09590 [Candidatus Dadabacteria bacterium]|nr:MAG: hypothetical protein D6719_09590 [Candidatus Dadabacteria bacterium]